MPTPSPPRVAVIVLAAGEGRRVGAATNKVLLPLLGRPVLLWSLTAALSLAYVDRLVVVTRSQDRAAVEGLLAEQGADCDVLVGGRTRHGSEWNALRTIEPAIASGDLDLVVIHDAARPLATTDLFAAVVRAATEHGAAVPAREQPALVPRDPGTGVHGTLVAVQTPQAFAARELLAAYRNADRDGFVGTDTAACVERYTDLRIHCVASPATNLKITHPEDMMLAERLLAAYAR